MKKIIFLFALSYFLIAYSCYSQWVTNYSDTSSNFAEIQFTTPNTGWAAGYKVNLNGTTTGRLAKTTNGGTSWTLQNTGTASGFWGLYFLNENTGWIVGDNGVILNTTNGGLNWIESFIYLTDYHENVYFQNQNTGWITGSNFYKTTNGGINWVQQTMPPPGPVLAIVFLDDNTGFVTSYYSKIYKTTNGGLNWSLKYEGQFHTFIYDMAFVNANTGYGVGDSELDGILKTTNGGDNWVKIYTDNGLMSVYFTDEYTGWAGGLSKFLMTTNSGVNWTTQNLPVSIIGSIRRITKSNDSTLWAVGGKGFIFKTTNGGVGINQISTEVPGEYKLWQNYPNPFNPSTKIRFDVMRSPTGAFKSEPLRGFGDDNLVVLKVYDVQGREVKTLVNERMAVGTYEVSFDGSGLNSGVYFYQMKAGKYNETKRLVLVK